MIGDHRGLDGPLGELVTATGKAAPPIAVATATASGLTLQDWVLITTLVYTLMQIAWLIWRVFFQPGKESE